MQRAVSVVLLIALAVPVFGQQPSPPCTPSPGQTTCYAPGAKNIWNGPEPYALIGIGVGATAALIIRHHYHHKAQAELERLQALRNPESPNGLLSHAGTTKDWSPWGFSGTDWQQGDFTGVQVLRVSTNSVAENAGLNIGSVITTINGKGIGSTQELAATLAQIEPGSPVTIGYLIKTQLAWLPKEATLTAPKLR